jgi:hypothetical protein
VLEYFFSKQINLDCEIETSLEITDLFALSFNLHSIVAVIQEINPRYCRYIAKNWIVSAISGTPFQEFISQNQSIGLK